MIEDEGQLHTLGLLERLRDECKSMWGASTDLYFRVDKLLNQLANPNLHDIPSNLSFHIELWDRYDQHIRWVIAAMHPQERVLLRQGIRVVRKHKSNREADDGNGPSR